jgi:hypothetical protein
MTLIAAGDGTGQNQGIEAHNVRLGLGGGRANSGPEAGLGTQSHRWQQ